VWLDKVKRVYGDNLDITWKNFSLEQVNIRSLKTRSGSGRTLPKPGLCWARLPERRPGVKGRTSTKNSTWRF